jgi:predicted MFS family arabinose efflux permease
MRPPSDTESVSVQGVILGLGLAYFGAYQLFKLPVVLPILLTEYGYDRSLAGGFMSVYAAAGLVLSVWIGRRIGQFGPFKPVSTALVLMILANLATLINPASGLLVLCCRAVEGAAFAVLAISGPVLANRFAGPRALPIVIGLTAMWIPTGQLTAALLASASLDSVGWQLLWHVGVVGSLLFAVWCHRFHSTHPAAQADRSGTAAKSPPLDTRRRRLLLLSSVIFLLWSGQYFAYMTWLPQYVIEVHGTSLNGALFSYLMPVVMLMIFNVVTGFWLRSGLRVGLLLTCAMSGQLAVWCLLPWTTSTAAGVVSLLVYGISAGIVPVCLFAMPSTLLGAGVNTGAAFGVIMTGRNIGVLIGPILVAQLFKTIGSWDLAAPVFGLCTAAALTLSIVLARQLQRLTETLQPTVQTPFR